MISGGIEIRRFVQIRLILEMKHGVDNPLDYSQVKRILSIIHEEVYF